MYLLTVILGYAARMAPPALVGGAVCLALTPMRRARLAKRGLGESGVRVLWLALFAAYGAGLFGLALQPSGGPAGTLHYNLVPFRIFGDIAAELRAGNAVGFFISFLGNIVMFLPLGFFPGLLWRGTNWKRAMAVGFCCSLTIELCQLPLGRSSDIDDLWMNTVSAWMGYGLYCMWKKRWPKGMTGCQVCTVEEGEPTWKNR